MSVVDARFVQVDKRQAPVRHAGRGPAPVLR
jgi:hypothetical protein